jgi:hypothetical protein
MMVKTYMKKMNHYQINLIKSNFKIITIKEMLLFLDMPFN